TGNVTVFGGGGLYCDGGNATIRNSTISGNSTNSGGHDSFGGGIFTHYTVLSIRNTTIAFNNAGTKDGGGLSARSISPNYPVVESSIFANNTATFGPDVSGGVVAKYCLLGSSSGATLAAGSISNVLNVNPLLAPLANNGGPTKTHRLQAGSPAINQG